MQIAFSKHDGDQGGLGPLVMDTNHNAGSMPLDLEVPVTWLPSDLDGERHRQMFAQLCTVLANRSFDIRMKPVAHGMHDMPRTARTGGITLSYHSSGDEPNVWRIKETSIPGWYSFDRNGFSGWSSLARFPEQHEAKVAAVDHTVARNHAHSVLTALRSRNLSKYRQSSEDFSADRPYVYFPLQRLDDSVSTLSRLNALEVLYKAAELAEKTGILLVVKRHPLCQVQAMTDALAEIQSRYPNSAKVSSASIHSHLQGCRAVLVANSGVGMEALLYMKPVFTFAASEYELGTFPISSIDEIEKAFAPEVAADPSRAAQFMYYYMNECCFSVFDARTIDRCIDKAVQEVSQTAGLAAPQPAYDGRQLTQVYGQLERMRMLLTSTQAENGHLRRVANQALELVKRGEATATAQVENAAPAPTASLARDVAVNLHAGALSASIGEVIHGMSVRSAYMQYADMAALARQAPQLISAVDAQLLHSGPASGTDPRVRQKNRTADDYQRLHNYDKGYQDNNWLVDHCDVIASARPTTIAEVGCGNGRFLRKIAPLVPRVIGLDWARSPQLAVLPQNVEFRPTDVLKDDLPAADICVSADVLEHFEPQAIPALLRKMHGSARYNYHVIACYDDGHSHCSVFHPGQWAALFKTISPDYRLIATITRLGHADRIACVITNIPGAGKFFPKLGPVVGTWQTETGQRLSFMNDFTVRIDGNSVATWFPMANGTAAMKWNTNSMVDTLTLNQDGSRMTVRNLDGLTFQVSRAEA